MAEKVHHQGANNDALEDGKETCKNHIKPRNSMVKSKALTVARGDALSRVYLQTVLAKDTLH